MPSQFLFVSVNLRSRSLRSNHRNMYYNLLCNFLGNIGDEAGSRSILAGCVIQLSGTRDRHNSGKAGICTGRAAKSEHNRVASGSERARALLGVVLGGVVSLRAIFSKRRIGREDFDFLLSVVKVCIA